VTIAPVLSLKGFPALLTLPGLSLGQREDERLAAVLGAH